MYASGKNILSRTKLKTVLGTIETALLSRIYDSQTELSHKKVTSCPFPHLHRQILNSVQGLNQDFSL